MKKLVFVCMGLCIFWPVPAGAIENYTSLAAYNAAVGPHTGIDFTALATETILSDQYAGLGVLFTDGDAESCKARVAGLKSCGAAPEADAAPPFSSSSPKP